MNTVVRKLLLQITQLALVILLGFFSARFALFKGSPAFVGQLLKQVIFPTLIFLSLANARLKHIRMDTILACVTARFALMLCTMPIAMVTDRNRSKKSRFTRWGLLSLSMVTTYDIALTYPLIYAVYDSRIRIKESTDDSNEEQDPDTSADSSFAYSNYVLIWSCATMMVNMPVALWGLDWAQRQSTEVESGVVTLHRLRTNQKRDIGSRRTVPIAPILSSKMNDSDDHHSNPHKRKSFETVKNDSESSSTVLLDLKSPNLGPVISDHLTSHSHAKSRFITDIGDQSNSQSLISSDGSIGSSITPASPISSLTQPKRYSSLLSILPERKSVNCGSVMKVLRKNVIIASVVLGLLTNQGSNWMSSHRGVGFLNDLLGPIVDSCRFCVLFLLGWRVETIIQQEWKGLSEKDNSVDTMNNINQNSNEDGNPHGYLSGAVATTLYLESPAKRNRERTDSLQKKKARVKYAFSKYIIPLLCCFLKVIVSAMVFRYFVTAVVTNRWMPSMETATGDGKTSEQGSVNDPRILGEIAFLFGGGATNADIIVIGRQYGSKKHVTMVSLICLFSVLSVFVLLPLEFVLVLRNDHATFNSTHDWLSLLCTFLSIGASIVFLSVVRLDLFNHGSKWLRYPMNLVPSLVTSQLCYSLIRFACVLSSAILGRCLTDASNYHLYYKFLLNTVVFCDSLATSYLIILGGSIVWLFQSPKLYQDQIDVCNQEILIEARNTHLNHHRNQGLLYFSSNHHTSATIIHTAGKGVSTPLLRRWTKISHGLAWFSSLLIVIIHFSLGDMFDENNTRSRSHIHVSACWINLHRQSLFQFIIALISLILMLMITYKCLRLLSERLEWERIHRIHPRPMAISSSKPASERTALVSPHHGRYRTAAVTMVSQSTSDQNNDLNIIEDPPSVTANIESTDKLSVISEDKTTLIHHNRNQRSLSEAGFLNAPLMNDLGDQVNSDPFECQLREVTPGSISATNRRISCDSTTTAPQSTKTPSVCRPNSPNRRTRTGISPLITPHSQSTHHWSSQLNSNNHTANRETHSFSSSSRYTHLSVTLDMYKEAGLIGDENRLDLKHSVGSDLLFRFCGVIGLALVLKVMETVVFARVVIVNRANAIWEFFEVYLFSSLFSDAFGLLTVVCLAMNSEEWGRSYRRFSANLSSNVRNYMSDFLGCGDRMKAGRGRSTKNSGLPCYADYCLNTLMDLFCCDICRNGGNTRKKKRRNSRRSVNGECEDSEDLEEEEDDDEFEQHTHSQ